MRFKKTMAVVLSLIFVFTTVMAGVVVKATGSISLTVTLQGAVQTESGKVQYKDATHDSWTDITFGEGATSATISDLSSGESDDALFVRIVPNTGKEVDFAPLNLDGSKVNNGDSVANALTSDNGYKLTGKGSYTLGNIEFKDAQSGGPGPEPGLDAGDIGITVQNSQNGKFQYRVGDSVEFTDFNGGTLRKAEELNNPAENTKIYFKLVPNEGQSIDDFTGAGGETNLLWFEDEGENSRRNYFKKEQLENGTASITYDPSKKYRVELEFKGGGQGGPGSQQEISEGEILVQINGSQGKNPKFEIKVGTGAWKDFPEGEKIDKSFLFGEGGTAQRTTISIRMKHGKQDGLKPSANNNDNFAEEMSDYTNHYKEVFNGDKRTALWNNGGTTGDGVSFSYDPAKKYRINIELVDENKPDPAKRFEGSVYFVWSGANDSLESYKIEELKSGNEINYVSVSSIKSGDNVFSINNADEGIYYYILWDREDEDGKPSTEKFLRDFNSFSGLRDELDRNGDKKKHYAVDPLFAENGVNSIRSDGDHEFKLTIYNDDYVGISFDTNPDNHYYIPSFWDETFYSNVVDISGYIATEEESNIPEFEAFILEDSLTIHEIAKGKDITAIVPTGVPERAVVVEDAGDDSWNITFNSNFFDRVTFKATTRDGKTLLFTIVRTAIQAFDADNNLIAVVYYDREDSYENYEVWATVKYSDDSRELIKIKHSKIYDMIDNRWQLTNKDETNGGKNLKRAHFALPIENGMVGAYFNVTKRDALSGENFSGSVAGSVDGIYVEARRPN